MMKKYLYFIVLLSVGVFTACSDDLPDTNEQEGRKIELLFSIQDFTVDRTATRTTRATDSGSSEEQQIDNVYVFLFDASGSNPIRRFGTPGSFTGGDWTVAEGKVTLNLKQVEVGARQVYIVANYSDALASRLATVTSLSDLQAIFEEISLPWSDQIKAPFLMSGDKTHDFTTDYQLKSVSLKRAVAKLELRFTLGAEHQSVPLLEEGMPGNTTSVAQYKYKYVNFDKSTYLFKPTPKPDNLTGSADWVDWEASSYTVDASSGKVTALNLTTYLNERDAAGTAVELSLPIGGVGNLPPPEFGNETYKLQLPAQVERNHWYIYDIEIE